ncbi:UNVERIFIED_CONTAM: Sucrose nonfermenting 4-like protein, partial [Sesamum indicum]
WSERMPMFLVEGSENIFQRIIDLPPGCYQVLALDIEVDVEQAFHVMYDSASQDKISQESRRFFGKYSLKRNFYVFPSFSHCGLAVMPLWDENRGQMVGMLTASDFILILLQLHRNHAMFGNAELEVRTIATWKDWKLQHHRDIIRAMVPIQRRPLIHVNALTIVDSLSLSVAKSDSPPSPSQKMRKIRALRSCLMFLCAYVVHAGPDDALADVASRILQNNISAVPIIHSVDGSAPSLLHIASLAGILKDVCRNFKNHLGYLTLLQQPVGYLPLGTWSIEVRRALGRPLLTLHPNDPLSSALTLLLEAQISSIPIVDHSGNFINIYSRSDITSLAKDNIYTRIQLNQMTVSQALELTAERGRSRYKTCTRFDSLYRVMELLSEPDMRRVIVVEASSRHVEGIITLRDVFDFFSRFSVISFDVVSIRTLITKNKGKGVMYL